MKEMPQFLRAYAEILKGLLKMVDGLPNRDEIIKSLDAAAQALPGPVPGGMPEGGAPPIGPPPTGLPFVPATLSQSSPGPVGSPTVMGMPPGGGP